MNIPDGQRLSFYKSYFAANMISEVQLANVFAEEAHRGQFRRDGKTPYIEHIFAVKSRISPDDVSGQIVASLHDVLEDSHFTAADLLDFGFRPYNVNAVVALTKTKDVAYDTYIKNIKRDALAKRVKIADMLANLSDKPLKKQILKYAKALTYLLED